MSVFCLLLSGMLYMLPSTPQDSEAGALLGARAREYPLLPRMSELRAKIRSDATRTTKTRQTAEGLRLVPEVLMWRAGLCPGARCLPPHSHCSAGVGWGGVSRRVSKTVLALAPVALLSRCRTTSRPGAVVIASATAGECEWDCSRAVASHAGAGGWPAGPAGTAG